MSETLETPAGAASVLSSATVSVPSQYGGTEDWSVCDPAVIDSWLATLIDIDFSSCGLPLPPLDEPRDPADYAYNYGTITPPSTPVLLDDLDFHSRPETPVASRYIRGRFFSHRDSRHSAHPRYNGPAEATPERIHTEEAVYEQQKRETWLARHAKREKRAAATGSPYTGFPTGQSGAQVKPLVLFARNEDLDGWDATPAGPAESFAWTAASGAPLARPKVDYAEWLDPVASASALPPCPPPPSHKPADTGLVRLPPTPKRDPSLAAFTAPASDHGPIDDNQASANRPNRLNNWFLRGPRCPPPAAPRAVASTSIATSPLFPASPPIRSAPAPTIQAKFVPPLHTREEIVAERASISDPNDPRHPRYESTHVAGSPIPQPEFRLKTGTPLSRFLQYDEAEWYRFDRWRNDIRGPVEAYPATVHLVAYPLPERRPPVPSPPTLSRPIRRPPPPPRAVAPLRPLAEIIAERAAVSDPQDSRHPAFALSLRAGAPLTAPEFRCKVAQRLSRSLGYSDEDWARLDAWRWSTRHPANSNTPPAQPDMSVLWPLDRRHVPANPWVVLPLATQHQCGPPLPHQMGGGRGGRR